MEYYCEPAICPKCGKEITFRVIVSCNSFMMDMLPSNKCSCGYEPTEENIDLSKASPMHREFIRHKKIRNYIENNNSNDNNEWKCKKCGCSKYSGIGFRSFEIPDKYKNDDKVTIKNNYKVCSQCGHKTNDTFEEYSDFYDLIEVLDDGEFLCRQKDNYEEIYKRYEEEDRRKYKDAEDYLVSIGEITSEEYEEEYADKYYGKHIDKETRNMMMF